MQRAVIDVVDVHKRTVKNFRMWDLGGGGCANVLEGQAIYLDGGTALVCCTGAATLSTGVTADPCMLVMREGDDIRRAAQAFFALSQLNYSSPSKAHRYAQPGFAQEWEPGARLPRSRQGLAISPRRRKPHASWDFWHGKQRDRQLATYQAPPAAEILVQSRAALT